MNYQVTCRGTRKDGEPCQSTFIRPDGFCPAHGEGGAERMRERARRGGQAIRRKFAGEGLPAKLLGDLETIPDAQRWLRMIAEAVGDRNITHAEGHSMTHAVKSWLKAEETRLRAEDLQALQEEIAKLKQGRMRAV